MYAFLLVLGMVGIVSTTLLGFLRGGHRGGKHRIAGNRSGAKHSLKAGVKHSGPKGKAQPLAKTADGGIDQPTTNDAAVAWLSLIPSPIDIFALATGAGAAGFALQGILDQTQTLIAAVIGAVVFDFGIVKPLFSLGAKFVTKESEGIEGLVAHTALATCRFDTSGKGLVQVELDGQFVQILAQLERDEFENDVQKGDELVITEIDATKGSCRVSRDLAGSSRNPLE